MMIRITCIALFSLLACSCSEEVASTDEKTNPAPPADAKPVETVVEDISAKTASEKLGDDGDLVVIDVRTPAEFAEGHIEGAVNIDFKGPSFDAELAKLDHDKPYVVHCMSGGRSGMSLSKFREAGFKKIYHLNHGFMEWENSGLPVEK